MKIAVLGANGFVGSSIARYFAQEHLVLPVTRATINLLDPVLVERWLKAHKFDVVINAATTMGDFDALADTRNNLGLFMNFYNNRDLFGRFINYSSGAEFDRRNDIDQYQEHQIFDVMPVDSYGFGQNMKSRISWGTKNFYTIRIFNCFGLGEISTRIFPRMLAATKDKPLTITNDREFDYFGIRDLCALTGYFVNSDPKVSDVNAVYLEKFKISTVLEKFCQSNNLEHNYRIESAGGNRYTGNGRTLAALPVQLLGLENELKHYNEPLY
jgi:nucleoside-diphosphate-sugar epimerase